MPTFKLNGNTYSGSTNYASAIGYIEKDGTKTTVQNKIEELHETIDEQNKKIENAQSSKHLPSFELGSYYLVGTHVGAGSHKIFSPVFTEPHNISVKITNLGTENYSKLRIFVDGSQYLEYTSTANISFTVDVQTSLEIIDYKTSGSYGALEFDSLIITFNS